MHIFNIKTDIEILVVTKCNNCKLTSCLGCHPHKLGGGCSHQSPLQF